MEEKQIALVDLHLSFWLFLAGMLLFLLFLVSTLLAAPHTWIPFSEAPFTLHFNDIASALVPAAQDSRKKLDGICQAIIDNVGDADYSVKRKMFNAKQQILNLEMLLTAAQNDDANDFKEARERLDGQSTH